MENVLCALNTAHLPANIFAKCEYTKAYEVKTAENPKGQMVQKARVIPENIAAKFGVSFPEKGTKNPFCGKEIIKISRCPIKFGTGIKYETELNKVITNTTGMIADASASFKDTGFVPWFEELFYVNHALTKWAMRAYPYPLPTKTAKSDYYEVEGVNEDGSPILKLIPLVQILPWLESKDFDKICNPTKETASQKDEFGKTVVAQDEEGNIILDANGNPMTIPYPKLNMRNMFDPTAKRAWLRRPLKVFLGEREIISEILSDKFIDMNLVKTHHDNFMENIAKAKAKYAEQLALREK